MTIPLHCSFSKVPHIAFFLARLCIKCISFVEVYHATQPKPFSFYFVVISYFNLRAKTKVHSFAEQKYVRKWTHKINKLKWIWMKNITIVRCSWGKASQLRFSLLNERKKKSFFSVIFVEMTEEKKDACTHVKTLSLFNRSLVTCCLCCFILAQGIIDYTSQRRKMHLKCSRDGKPD